MENLYEYLNNTKATDTSRTRTERERTIQGKALKQWPMILVGNEWVQGEKKATYTIDSG